MQKYFDDTVRAIREIVRFDSSQSAPQKGMPFGKGAADCLAYFLDLADKMGFETYNYDNYAGEVLFGEGEDFAVLCHLDVVPAGSGWTHPPFGGEIADGKIYGRGTTDDKGPAVICLYCLKALKDEGFSPKKRIRLIVGCNEENGWACIDHYRKCARLPETGFSPDADFPVIYAEKGILQVRLSFPLQHPPFTRLYGGERANMVCEFAAAEGVPDETGKNPGEGLFFEGGKLTATGRSAHASMPDEGDNALKKLFAMLSENSDEIKNIYEILFEDRYGLKKLCDETGSLTLSPDIAEYEKGTLSVVCDIRYPATCKRSEVLGLIDKFGVKYELLHCQAPLYSDREGFLVSTLKEVWKEATGREDEPIAIGGGTYARALKNGAAFGPQFPGEESTIHCKDEYISLKNVEKLSEIYRLAIRKLTE